MSSKYGCPVKEGFPTYAPPMPILPDPAPSAPPPPFDMNNIIDRFKYEFQSAMSQEARKQIMSHAMEATVAWCTLHPTSTPDFIRNLRRCCEQLKYTTIGILKPRGVNLIEDSFYDGYIAVLELRNKDIDPVLALGPSIYAKAKLNGILIDFIERSPTTPSAWQELTASLVGLRKACISRRFDPDEFDRILSGAMKDKGLIPCNAITSPSRWCCCGSASEFDNILKEIKKRHKPPTEPRSLPQKKDGQLYL